MLSWTDILAGLLYLIVFIIPVFVTLPLIIPFLQMLPENSWPLQYADNIFIIYCFIILAAHAAFLSLFVPKIIAIILCQKMSWIESISFFKGRRMAALCTAALYIFPIFLYAYEYEDKDMPWFFSVGLTLIQCYALILALILYKKQMAR